MGTETFLGLMAPELTIAATAILLFFIDWISKGRCSHRMFAWLALIGTALAFIFTFLHMGSPVTTVWGGTYRYDSFANAFKLFILLGTGFVLLLSVDSKGKTGVGRRGEFYYLMMTALLGAMMLTSSADMITLLVALELLSLPSCIMAGLRKDDSVSGETAFRMFANGGIATAIILFGMSYVYGFAGTTNLYGISLILDKANHNSLIFSHRYLLVFVFMIVLIGMAYKFASMWIPNIFEKTSVPAAAFLSSVPMIAGFVLLFRFFLIAFMNASGIQVLPATGPVSIFVTVRPYVAVIAALAMIVGNLAALRQKNMKHLFAWASFAQAGYLFMPFVSLTSQTFINTWFYLLAYLFMNLGSFAIIKVVSEKEKGDTSLKKFTGLYHRAPLAALAMAVFLISFAGVPVTAGFIGKYNIFVQAWNAGHVWLALVMIVAVLISCIYYFSLTVELFRKPDSSQPQKLSFPLGAGVVVFSSVVGTLAFGIFPDVALGFLQEHFPLTDFFNANF